MAKWLIVNKSNLQVANVYEAEAPSKFGGPWGDANKFMHLQVPEAIAGNNRFSVSRETAVVSVEYVECQCNKGLPIFREVYDKHGNLMIDPDGSPLYAKLYEKQDVYGEAYVIRAL